MNDKEPPYNSRMKYFSPAIYLGFQDNPNEDEWEKAIQKYNKIEFPTKVKDFINQLGNLHDSSYEFEQSNKNNVVIILFKYDFNSDYNVRGFIYCKEYNTRDIFPLDSFLHWTHDRTQKGQVLYDEFQYEDDKLSYHFFDSNGHEHSFEDILELKLEQVKNEN